MKRTPLSADTASFPSELFPFLEGALLFDSSCSPEARVFYLAKNEGYFLKCAPKGSLEKEWKMTDYFHSLGLGPNPLTYLSYEKDYLLTERIPGEDCTHSNYLEEPEKLCDTLAVSLRALHETEGKNCPVKNRTAEYLNSAAEGYRNNRFDDGLFLPKFRFQSAEEAWKEVERGGKYLKKDTLLHGDYCLPNIILDHFQFSGFIDLGCGGMGDRHIDLFWGVWTLFYNLKTDRYGSRFLDAYGRDLVNEDALTVIAASEVFG